MEQEPPQWLQALLGQHQQQIRALQDQNQVLQDQHQAQVQQLQAALAQTNDQLSQLQQRQADASTVLTPRDPSPAPQCPKASLPESPMFNGDRKEYEGWRALLQNKLETDGDVIGSRMNQFRYVAARLEHDGLKLALTYITQNRASPTASGMALLEYLDTIFGDKHKKQRATEALRTIRQKSQEPFATFLPRFEKVLADAGGMNWPDDVKRSYLDGSLTFELRRLVVTMPAVAEYSAYVSELLRLSDLYRATMRHAPKESVPAPSQRSELMDWEPTRATSATTGQRKRARWVSDEVLDERRETGSCMRCGKTGHFIKDCTLLPPIRPQQQQQQSGRRQSGRPQQSSGRPQRSGRQTTALKAQVEEQSGDDGEVGFTDAEEELNG